MSCYINSTNERLYTALETDFGAAANLAATDRLSFRSLMLTEDAVRVDRRDKTGSRTRFAPHPEIRAVNQFDLQCYFPGRDPANPVDAITNLSEGALGGERITNSGLVVSGVGQDPASLTFTTAHGLQVGEALRFGGELRFVKAVSDTNSALLSASFGAGMQAGSTLGTSVTLYPGDKPKSATIGDYWTPAGTLDRILTGCVVDEMEVALNSDFHGARFRGVTREVVTSTAFSAGSSGLSEFPAEASSEYQPFQLVPGHVGRLFIGGMEFFLLRLFFRLRNQVDAKAREFGLRVAPCYSADLREVSVQFDLYASTKPAVTNLHAIARNREETDLTIQLGNRAGQLVGIYVPRFVPEIPEIADADSRAVMSYPTSLAYGVANDEITIAFA